MTPTTEIDKALGILPQESRNAILDKLKDFSGIPTVILDIHSLESTQYLGTVRPSAEAQWQLAASCRRNPPYYLLA